MVEHEVTSWLDRVVILISRVAMLLVAVIVLIIFYEVIMRYLFARPTLWVNEMSLWLGGMIYLLSGLYVMQQRGHIRIFILYDLAPRWLQRILDLISTLFICLFAFAVVYGGFREARDKLLRWETFGTAWDPPIPATIKPLILVTVVLIAIQAVANLIADWHIKEKETHTPADDI
ncbi:MAG: TRAP transporter small permease subunit [Geminicoccaceae bacterium]